jgi:hypothetical protein
MPAIWQSSCAIGRPAARNTKDFEGCGVMVIDPWGGA